MNIIVCIKQVPDTSEVKLDPETNTLIREGVPSIVNPFDENAVEAALQIREKFGGKVTVITMGPPQAKDALKKCVSMGADDAYLLSDKAFAGSDTWATSYTLSRAIKKLGDYDLILCGKQAIDGDTAQVGPGIAEHLDFPQVTYVQEIDEVNDDKIRLKRLVEGATHVMNVSLPAVLTVEKSVNNPRYPSIKGIMRSSKMEIPVLVAKDLDTDPNLLGLDGSPTEVRTVFPPESRGEGEMISGEPEEAAKKLVGKILDLKIV
ncbi:electron transfer flavoprotein subunit beta/FixA family protein [Natranaerobius trueperi]|uniref:Electron transfer flavoprotein small subunit n=1 Tax=Natranaerobius trueperi TaxID=759412 RepID=A0A226BZ60_9FIRM|nr:electron transfer flavoprotein subunit beta/FixA family protein [Natranaerobius trueperi]OWZ84072.1 electron transfer flavoprotein subunit beta [Natranaerobius trueperi]